MPYDFVAMPHAWKASDRCSPVRPRQTNAISLPPVPVWPQASDRDEVGDGDSSGRFGGEYGDFEEMNGGGGVEAGLGGGGEEEMDEDGVCPALGMGKEQVVLMWGYLPGVSPQRSPLLAPVPVRLPLAATGDAWRDVCGGGCGFAMAISESGKLLTWGSTDDMGQSYVTAGKHEETPEAFPLPSDVVIARADTGWAHCVAITEEGVVYTWGWKECVPTGTVIADQSSVGTLERDESQSASASNQVSPRSHVSSRTSSGAASGPSESRGAEESTKRRRLSSAKQGPDSSTSSDENLSAPPCIVTFNTGVKITAVAAGGRHTLALSDFGQVWGWGYGGEGQLGLGSRIRTVSSPHPIPCIESALYGKDRPAAMKGNKNAETQISKVMGNCVKAIACGGRHSVVVTDSGTLLTFGWGLYGQCGQGNTDDVLSPTCVSSILGVKMEGAAAGLWHTVCISVDGDVYSFGGNQFGQLGTGSDEAEVGTSILFFHSSNYINRSRATNHIHSSIQQEFPKKTPNVELRETNYIHSTTQGLIDPQNTNRYMSSSPNV
ncbi:hypothetical protein BRADI_2g54850v3 [Brachypodium distachyon]|uniref:Ultraviolet-B receptor UVR8 n=1 Tax=Brachypodium distachyon TaxID=15368 RepID=A0A2K2DFX8_BRADI|nr:hypothetical protein BRADI_2g54850v3 [Brachypodium distachyon]